jgi:hypothetical protein
VHNRMPVILVADARLVGVDAVGGHRCGKTPG